MYVLLSENKSGTLQFTSNSKLCPKYIWLLRKYLEKLVSCLMSQILNTFTTNVLWQLSVHVLSSLITMWQYHLWSFKPRDTKLVNPLTLFLPTKGGISPYISVTWPSPVGIGLNKTKCIVHNWDGHTHHNHDYLATILISIV